MTAHEQQKRSGAQQSGDNDNALRAHDVAKRQTDTGEQRAPNGKGMIAATRENINAKQKKEGGHMLIGQGTQHDRGEQRHKI